MSIYVIGVNHKTAPVSIREKVAFAPGQIAKALQSCDVLEEGLILSTCNRTEIYMRSKQGNPVARLTVWLANFHQLPVDQLEPFLYVYEQDQAVRHVLRVACGLDSLVLGEPQILGQLKTAKKISAEHRFLGHQLRRLMQHAFTTAKQVRTQTSIGSNPISVAFAAVNLAKQIFSDLAQQRALLIGAGETIELVGRHLHTHNIGKIMVANRTLEKAEKLAQEYQGEALTLEEIPDYLAQADIVISSTAAPIPILGKGAVERALKKRRHQPMFMVDIAVPRDIEEEVGELDDVYLYTVDDLQSVIQENLKSRQQAAEQAEAMVLEYVDEFMAWLKAQDSVDMIRRYRQQADQTRQDVLQKALQHMQNGKSAEEAMQFLAHTLSNKLTHHATRQMSDAAKRGDRDVLRAARVLLGLD